VGLTQEAYYNVDKSTDQSRFAQAK
jgi:hypothetical protein